MLRCLIVISFLISFQSFAHAECDFKTAKFLNELKDPSNINSIEIKVAKSAKFARNFFKILTSKKDNIPPKLRKRFKGTVVVNYKFGKCQFTAKIRQSGDRKDHVKLIDNGKALRSIDVRLNEGNVVRATRFKLLIPETRNGINEVLASLILKESGFIAPETFEVPSVINDTNSIMIFQEVASKELLERNYRRESAIFKGDESLLWSYKDHEKFALEPLALSTMVNDNWFMKGASSQKISLHAYLQLQSNYLSYAAKVNDRLNGTWGIILDPNHNGSEIFSKFHFLLLAMNGAHGLRPHNRKYYFNTFESDFDPIYYDGDVEFVVLKSHQMGHEIGELVSKMFTQPIDGNWIKKIEKIINSEKLKNNFIARVRIPMINAIDFFDKSVSSYFENIKKLENLIETTPFKISKHEKTKKDEINSYLKFQESNNVSQRLISEIKTNNNDFMVTYISGQSEILSKAKIANVIAKNSIDGQRVTLINSKNFKIDINTFARKIKNFPGKIIATPGILINIDKDSKSILFTQSNNHDWAMIDSAKLDGWNIKFYGINKATNINLKAEQRLNQYGLTGCLTIYRSDFNNSIINVNGGKCEDSLNIVQSRGDIDLISINNAFADALDIDFSKINVLRVEIFNAGNDCLDVSEGKYKIDIIQISECGDKGISVGEQSTFNTKEVKIDFANIGISSKDLSAVYVNTANFNQVKTCIEVKQKKQEFGGAYLSVNNIVCQGVNKIDKHSIFELGKS